MVISVAAVTNSIEGSVVPVRMDELICTLSVVPNEFSDLLPIIPSDSRLKDNKVLYRLILLAKLVCQKTGKPKAGQRLFINSDRAGDVLDSAGETDNNGELKIQLETRMPGAIVFRTSSPRVVLSNFSVFLKEAWYESPFLITGYNVCSEGDFSGELVEGNGLAEKHKEDFLFGARGVPMQGTGLASDGKYIALKKMGGPWRKNARGAPVALQHPKKASFQYTNGVQGKYGAVSDKCSIAVDPKLIPPLAKVEIDGLGTRWAHDTGSMIKNYHIDNFLGAGAAVVKDWLSGGINGTKRRVKYFGD